MWVSVVFLLIRFSGAAAVIKNESGVHCAIITVLNTQTNAMEDVERCVECMFPQNCLEDNDCRSGSDGKMCEKCETGYHHVGNQCSECPEFPWTAVSFGIYLLLVLLATCCNGFSGSLGTKIRLLCHFVQNLYLTFLIKLPWPRNFVSLAAIINFGSFDSKVIMTECLFRSWPTISMYYIDWLITMLLPLAILILGGFVDRSVRAALQVTNNSTESNKRTVVWRVVVMVIVVMYMPSTLSAVQTFQCSNALPEEQLLHPTRNEFLRDYTFPCETFVYQTIHFGATIYFIIIAVLFPLFLVLFTLRQKKWNFLTSDAHLYGPLYEAYKDNFCYWETVSMLRKLAAILVIELPSVRLSPYIQTLVQMGMSAFYVLCMCVFRPYRSCTWGSPLLNLHVVFEVLSNIALLLVQAVGLLVILDYYTDTYSLVAIIAVFVIISIWVIMVVVMRLERTIVETNTEAFDSADRTPQTSMSRTNRVVFWRSKKIDHDPDLVAKVAQNRKQVHF